jgi:hypothetical protein
MATVSTSNSLEFDAINADRIEFAQAGLR